MNLTRKCERTCHLKRKHEVGISEGLISGLQYSDGSGENDRDLSGVEALGAIKVKSLAMHKCGLGPKAISVMALPSRLSKAVAQVDTNGNKIGSERHERTLRIARRTGAPP